MPRGAKNIEAPPIDSREVALCSNAFTDTHEGAMPHSLLAFMPLLECGLKPLLFYIVNSNSKYEILNTKY